MPAPAARLFATVLLLAAAPALHAQGGLAEYRRADTIIDELQPLIRNLPGFDHARLAAALAAAGAGTFEETALPLATGLVIGRDLSALRFDRSGTRWTCTLTDYRCESGPVPGPAARDDDGPRRSPDGQWDALIMNYNVHIRPAAGGAAVALSRDGSEGDAYELGSIRWSPDSRKIAAYRVRPGYRRLVHYVESSPRDQVQPKYSTRPYPKPGDVLDTRQPVIFDIASRQQFIVDNALFPNAYDLRRPVWRDDSRSFSFEYNERGHRVYRVIEVDATTGRARAAVSEATETFFSYYSTLWRRDVNDGREILWLVERDGWKHIWLYDGTTGRVKNQVTRGPWVVRHVEHVDEERRQIIFAASGVEPGRDPYLIDIYRINFDGTGMRRLTQGDGHHAVTFSPGREYFVDVWSRVDLPPVAELRRTSDGSLVMELERTDIAALEAAGWRRPEVFSAKGRDGKTDIWGIIIRPTNFDPNRRYPVIENIYAGPHNHFVPKTFSLQAGMQALAELGFIVVQMDGMGTAQRSKAFHDVAWKNIGDAGFPDRILWHQAVAAKYAYYDIDRVGIYGTSAGGQSSMGALLFHPDFYKVAVSFVGCHDNRMDKISWNEQWMSWPVGPEYEASSNVVHAHRLQGKLLLMVGELDTNVDPASTLQVVDALIRADRDFDFLYMPGTGHSSGGAYGTRKRNDFFVRHLLGVEPPAWRSRLVLGSLRAEDEWLHVGDDEDAPRVHEWR
jgi:dipeptidyl aminopeptidase/acylaminoacyl peptidase